MAKLMKHRRYIVKADEGRLPRGGLRQVGNVIDDGQVAEKS
jgi:hypothetical protein